MTDHHEEARMTLPRAHVLEHLINYIDMTSAVTRITATREAIPEGLSALIPDSLQSLVSLDNEIPRLAKDRSAITKIRQALQLLPTRHDLYCGDARRLEFIPDQSVHLVITSPPYWTLKRYEEHASQLGHWEDYDTFLDQLDEVWTHCLRVLVPGGRLVCVVGDVCLSRRKNNGRHTVVPLHASIQERCRKLGYDNLSPIIWHKIANANYEAEGGGGGFLGKPYEPNAVIKNDIEFILMERKSGGYRKPASPTRIMSIISEEEHREWFQQIWHGLTGASTRDHPAPYPVELAERIIRMFSFAGDTVLDPFMGTGSTTLAASKAGRNSIGVELIPEYFDFAAHRIDTTTQRLFGQTTIELHRAPQTMSMEKP